MPTAREIAAQINAELGEGTIRVASDPDLQVTYWPTGVLPFDVLLGGGLPAGRSVEIYGDYSTLKSYLALRAVANVQANGGTAAIVDTEHAFDPVWAENLGVDLDELIVQRPPTGEKAVQVTEVLVRNQTDLVVWDSVAATQPKAAAERNPDDTVQPGRLAALMSEGLRRITAANSKTALLFINQTRINVGMVFGNPESVPGGKALPFYASMRVRFLKGGTLTRPVKSWDGDKMVDTKEVTGIKIKASLQKSKLNKPFREVWFTFDLDSADIDELSYIIAKGLEDGLIEKNAAMWNIPDVMDKPIRGQDKFREWLNENPDVIEGLSERILGYEDDEEE